MHRGRDQRHVQIRFDNDRGHEDGVEHDVVEHLVHGHLPGTTRDGHGQQVQTQARAQASAAIEDEDLLGG